MTTGARSKILQEAAGKNPVAVAIDTLAYARKLREAGFSEQQAEGQAEALAAAMTDSLATKQDLRELETRLEARFAGIDARFEHLDRQLDTRFAEQEKRSEVRIAELEKRIDIRFESMEHRMTVKLGGIMVAGIGAISVLTRLA